MAQDPELRDLVLLDRGVGAALAVCPAFGDQLAKDPRLIDALGLHPRTCAVLLACCVALAAPLVCDNALAKVLGHNEALGEEGGADPSWALVRSFLESSRRAHFAGTRDATSAHIPHTFLGLGGHSDGGADTVISIILGSNGVHTMCCVMFAFNSAAC